MKRNDLEAVRFVMKINVVDKKELRRLKMRWINEIEYEMKITVLNT